MTKNEADKLNRAAWEAEALANDANDIVIELQKRISSMETDLEILKEEAEAAQDKADELERKAWLAEEVAMLADEELKAELAA